MSLPDFFNSAPIIRVHEPLAELLGATADGVMEYRYADAVRLAGHSCPTVAGAFLTGRAALAALYPETLPQRGGVAVHMPAPETSGTTGVVAQLLTLLTGAAARGGFKGIGGRFSRNNLLSFAASSEGQGDAVRFKRLDTGDAVTVTFDASTVPAAKAQRALMPAVARGRANAEQLAEFAHAWQMRVRRILVEHADDPAVIHVSRAPFSDGAA